MPVYRSELSYRIIFNFISAKLFKIQISSIRYDLFTRLFHIFYENMIITRHELSSFQQIVLSRFSFHPQ